MSSERLADLFDGAARVLRPGRDDLVRFEVPTRGATGRASLVVQPATVDEVREVVRRAFAAEVRLLPQGANTGLVGASVPPADDPCVVLSLELLKSSQPDVDVTNASVLVSAGTRLTVLNEALARRDLQLPIDLAADPAIGGMIATNTGGNRMVRYGPMRRYVLGVEVVAADADATVYGRLGAVYKDSRGVDPVQLAVGSGGTLGVVTRAVLSLVPRVKSLETWWLALDDPSTAVDLYRRITRRRPELVSAFEFVSRAALERALAAPGARPNPFNFGVIPAAAVLLEVSSDGYDPEDDVFEDDLEGALNEGLASEAMLANHDWSWDLRHSVSDALRTFGVVLGHDISAPLSSLMPMRAAAIEAIGDVAPDTVVCDFGHAADGGLHLNVLVPKGLGPPSPDLAASVREAVDDVVGRFGGSYSAEHGLGPLNAARWLADTPQIEQRMIGALKDIVDPKRILGHPGHPYNLLPR